MKISLEKTTTLNFKFSPLNLNSNEISIRLKKLEDKLMNGSSIEVYSLEVLDLPPNILSFESNFNGKEISLEVVVLAQQSYDNIQKYVEKWINIIFNTDSKIKVKPNGYAKAVEIPTLEVSYFFWYYDIESSEVLVEDTQSIELLKKLESVGILEVFLKDMVDAFCDLFDVKCQNVIFYDYYDIKNGSPLFTMQFVWDIPSETGISFKQVLDEIFEKTVEKYLNF